MTGKIPCLYHIQSVKKAFGITLALFTCACSIFLIYYLSLLKENRDAEIQSFHKLSTLACEKLEKTFTGSQTAAHSAAYSAECQKYLLSTVPEVIINANRSAYDLLQYIYLYRDNYRDIVLLGTDTERKLSFTDAYTSIVSEAMTEAGLDDNRYFTKPFYSSPIQTSTGRYLVRLFPVYGNIDGFHLNQNVITGGIVYEIDDLLALVSLNDDPGNISVLLHHGKILGSTQPLPSKASELLLQNPTGQEPINIGGQRYLYQRNAVSNGELEVVFLKPVVVPVYSINTLALSMFAFLVLALALMLWIIRTLHSDIEKMSVEVRRLEVSGSPISTPHFNELQPISNTLNKTILSLQEAFRREQELITNNYEALLAQTKAELLAYRSQINPHFLFNTLESVRSLARHYHVKPVETLVSNMSQLFRYSLYTPMIVPFSSEAANLDNYLAIMEIRFPNRYHIKRDYAPETLAWPVLSMFLEPLAENILQHAFVGRTNGVILLRSFCRDGFLVIQVADNGIGMDETTLHWVIGQMKQSAAERASLDVQHAFVSSEYTNGSVHSKKSGSTEPILTHYSIGLSNIYRRLKLAFGENADISIRSKKDYYTVIEVTVPSENQLLWSAFDTFPENFLHRS